MPLHPQVATFLEQLARQKAHPFESLTVETTRRAALLGSVRGQIQPILDRIENRTILRDDGSELAIRIYYPEGNQPHGICLYFHGGGWVLNSIDTHDELVRHLTAASGCVFMNVEYRLAPEHKYPAAAEDAYTALCWASEHASEFGCDPSCIALAGDSAGGNLAAAACLMSRDRGGPKIAMQALIYPITDCDFERPSYRENGEGYFLTRREMIWYWNHYVETPEQMLEPYASPLRAPSLQGLPPTFILTAEFDPLRDEGEAFADALRAAGVKVVMHRYDGMIHAFFRRMQQFDRAHDAIQEVAGEIRSAFHAARIS
jgi:acetyl esterase